MLGAWSSGMRTHSLQCRGPKARLVEFPGVGHAPALMAEDQIGAVAEFLLG